MTYRQLITASKMHLGDVPPSMPGIRSLFPAGARWMYDRLQELQPSDNRPFDADINYTGYGLFKYGCCLTGALLPITAISVYSRLPLPAFLPILIPAAVGLFYFFEIHFLFLFPFLIDQCRQPLLASFQAAYKIGLGKCLTTVIPIAGYMMIGLLRRSNRPGNWYIGCLAIIIWYDHDIRNRL
jgi:hypothetical protein